MKKLKWKPRTEHPAITAELDVIGKGRAAAVRTALGVLPCFEGDTIVGAGELAEVHRPDGSKVVPNG